MNGTNQRNGQHRRAEYLKLFRHLLDVGMDAQLARREAIGQLWPWTPEGTDDRPDSATLDAWERGAQHKAPAFPRPKLLSELRRQDNSGRWLADGLIAFNGITLLTAFWKAGKSTAIAHLFKAMECGGTWFGQKVVECGGLIISEEPEDLWADRRDLLSIGDHIQVMERPFKGRPDMATWIEFQHFLAQEIVDHGHKLVLFDSIPNFWAVENENDAAQMMANVGPLRILNEAGAGVLLAHHPRKQEGDQGTAARGSGALSGFVDVLLELRRMNPGVTQDRQRVLTGLSRYIDTPNELVAELSPDGVSYRVLGTKFQAQQSAIPDTIKAILSTDEKLAKSAEEIKGLWPEDRKSPSAKSIKRALEAGLAKDWKRTGNGVNKDPYRYWLG